MADQTENPTITKIKMITQLVSVAYPIAGAAVGEIISLISLLPGITPETAAQLNAEIKAAQDSIKMFPS